MRFRLLEKTISFFEKKPFITWCITIAYAFVIFYFSSQENICGPRLFVGIPALIKHFLEYLIFAGLIYTSLISIKMEKKKALVLAMIISSFYGISDEIHQYFVPGRACDTLDWVADSLGSFIGSLFAFYQKEG